MSESMSELGVERRGAVVVWTIDRPARSNALSIGVIEALGELAREAAEDPEIRVVLLTGAGEKAFCAGADLKERRGMDEAAIRALLGRYAECWGAIDRCPKPVVAALNGVAFGGGLELALACDFRIAAAHARLGLTEVDLAIIPGGGGTQRLTRLVGEARAKELILFARRLDANEARELGLLHRVAEPDEDLMEAALRWIEPLTSKAPIAVSAALEAIDAAVDLPLEQGLVREAACYERTLVSRDRVEALDAFSEKRVPVFRGE